jgi:hypothetical protein
MQVQRQMQLLGFFASLRMTSKGKGKGNGKGNGNGKDNGKGAEASLYLRSNSRCKGKCNYWDSSLRSE